MPDPQRFIAHVSLLVSSYDAGIAFYVGKLGFDLLEDTHLGKGKRWVRVRPGSGGVGAASGRTPATSASGHASATRLAAVSAFSCLPRILPPITRG